MEMEGLADKLDELQSSKFDGRGVSCVQTIVAYLKAGDLDSARAVCFNESDKIRDNPEIRDIKELLERELVGSPF